MMKSTFSLALLAGFASGQVTDFSVASVLTKDTPGYLEITFTPTTRIAAGEAGTISFELPASTTSSLTQGLPLTAVIQTGATLDGTLAVAAVTQNSKYTFTRNVGALQSPETKGPITIKFGPTTGGTAGLVQGQFKITTSEDASEALTTVKGVHIADEVCNTVKATGNGCSCKTTTEPSKTYLCKVGKTCDKNGANEGAACKVAGETGGNGEEGTECPHKDGKTKNTAACACKAKNDAAADHTYTCKAEQVCDVTAKTAETACKARASNGSSLLLLAAFFLAMN